MDFRSPVRRQRRRLCSVALVCGPSPDNRVRPLRTYVLQARAFMSSQSQSARSWVVRRTRLPLLSLRCVACPSKSATVGDGRFRVNANGKLLDVWLLARCVSCDRPRKLTVHERMPVRSFDPAELHSYQIDDPELVASTLLAPRLGRRNRFTLDWSHAWRLETSPAHSEEILPFRVDVVFDDPIPIRPDALIALGVGVSRSEARRLVRCDLPLNRPTRSGFTFVLLDRD
ncbi:DUF1062 domain-containing protein [Georgenia deserti]|uniref:DUF1062 domain-containing protein n=1 Tax=Georgenia deserti TaxID=2093781 RepID=A0ABW4L0D3_9MICO